MAFHPPTFIDAQKVLASALHWAAHRSSLVMRAPIDVDGVTIEGAFLRGTAVITRPNALVCFQLEHDDRHTTQLWRIEWRPTRSHNNKGNGPHHLRYRPIRVSHDHPFALNWSEELQAMQGVNLPVAIPIDPEPADYASLLEFVGKEFRINNMAAVPPPPWEPILGET